MKASVTNFRALLDRTRWSHVTLLNHQRSRFALKHNRSKLPEFRFAERAELIYFTFFSYSSGLLRLVWCPVV